MSFEISKGFQLVDSYELLFASHSIEYSSVCKFLKT